MRRNFWYVTITAVLIVGTFVATLLSGNRPILGLDLQGGISVVLAPVGEVKNEASLNKAVDIIRNRVDALGVAEPEISRQGHTVIIDLPGVKDRDKASRLVGKTAELRFRKGPCSSSRRRTREVGDPTTAVGPVVTTTPPSDEAALAPTIASCCTRTSWSPSRPRGKDPRRPNEAERPRDACVVLPLRQARRSHRACTSTRPSSRARV